jgi:hypothetical protein
MSTQSESLEQRLQSFKAVLKQQDEAWTQARAELEAAGEMRFSVGTLPEISACESLTPFINATRA